MRRAAIGLIIGLFIAGGTGQALGDGFTFQPIVVPGQTETVAFSINNAGQVVGEYGCCVGGFALHGFLLSGGSFTTVDVPGASFTNVTAINNATQMAGFYGDATTHDGFFLSSGTVIPRRLSEAPRAGAPTHARPVAPRRSPLWPPATV